MIYKPPCNKERVSIINLSENVSNSDAYFKSFRLSQDNIMVRYLNESSYQSAERVPSTI